MAFYSANLAVIPTLTLRRPNDFSGVLLNHEHIASLICGWQLPRSYEVGRAFQPERIALQGNKCDTVIELIGRKLSNQHAAVARANQSWIR